jgi:hypothetical protein
MATIQLTLTDQERDSLVGLLETALKQARVEEHRTRAPTYREHVLHEEEAITSVLGKLGRGATPQSPRVSTALP